MQSLEQRKDELLKLTKKDIMSIAKDLGIQRYNGKTSLKKLDIINSILSKEYDNIQSKEFKDMTEEEKVEKKKRYVETVNVGILVAFKTPNGKYKSAMVIKRSTKRRLLKVVTKYEKEYIISFDDVIWVRTGTRWPRGVYQLLKGVENGKEK